MSRRRRLLLGCALLHGLIIVAICSRDTLSMVARGYTALPRETNPYAAKAENAIEAALGEQLTSRNPVRSAIDLYLRAAGIEVGYGFFAPNVPDNYKLVVELHYPDGRVEYELPTAGNAAAGLRLATLIDNVGDTPVEPLREVLVKMMVNSLRQEHPEVTMVRAVLGVILLPTPAEYRRGMRESYQMTRAYDFAFSNEEKARGAQR